MTARDRLIVVLGTLVLAVLAGSLLRPAAGHEHPRRSPAVSTLDRALDEGAVGPLDTLDPLYAASPAERDASALLFSGLTRLGATGVEPDLAQDWSVSRDGDAYTFRLRPDASWHDGSPLTADDVVFTVRSIQHPDYDGPLRGAWRGIAVERVDDRTVRFRVPSRIGGFLYATTSPITPAAQLAAVPMSARRGSIFGRRPVGSGPFALDAQDGSGVRLSRAQSPVRDGAVPTGLPEPTPDPIGEGGMRGIETITLHAYDDAAAVAEAFARGEVEAASGLTAADVAAVGGLPGTRTIRYPRTVLTAAFLNLRFDRPEFRDARTRRGLLLAHDRAAIVRDVLSGEGTVALGPVPPTSSVFDAAANPPIQHDAAQAQQLLASAGWTRADGRWRSPGAAASRPLEIATVDAGSNRVTHAVAERVAADWRRFGLDVELVSLAPAELAAERLDPRRYDIAVLDVDLGHDPDLYPLLVSSQAGEGGTNVSGYQSRALDVLLDAARGYAAPDVRRARFAELQRQLASELPLLPLVFADHRFVVSDELLGPSPREVRTPQERYWDVLTWRTADGPDR